MNIQEIKQIIKDITFAPSNLDMGWKWRIKESFNKKGELEGFLIQTSFKRPDTNTGKMGTGYGRWMFVSKDSDKRGVTMTAWICSKLIVEHELMEAFLYQNIRILDPHKTLEALAYPHELKKSKTRK
jgi:hypothetical protein